MKNRMQKLFLSLTLALCAINLPSNAAQVVAAGLKGTYNDVPADLRALSPLHGAVMAENGDLKTLWADDKGPLGNLARKMFKEINGTMRITTQASNPVAVLSLDGITKIMELVHADKLCADLLFTGQEATLENLTPFGKAWFAAYESWKNGNTKPQIKNNFLQNALAFLQAVDTAVATDKPTTERILTAFVYLVSKTPEDLHIFLKHFYPALSDTSFTDNEYQTFTDLFTTTALDAKEAKTNVEQMAFWLLQKKSSSLYFLRVPLQNTLVKKKEVPLCVEGAIQTAFNCILFDVQEQKLNFSHLNPTVIQTLNPAFKKFIETHNNPHIADYFKTTHDDAVALLSKIPGITYVSGAYELDASTQNTLAVFNYLFGTHATDFKELGTALSSKTRTIQFSRRLILTEEEEQENFDYSGAHSPDDIDPFEPVKQIQPHKTPTEETPATSTNTSDPNTSDDESSEDDDDSDKDDDDEQEISLASSDEKQFITITITDNDNLKNPVIVEMTIDPSKHSETNFIDKNGRVLSSTQLENIAKVSRELGQKLLPLISIDWYRTIVKYHKEKPFADKASFLAFLQTHKPPVANLIAASDSDDYLLEDIILLGRLDLLKALHEYGVDLVKAPTELGLTTLEESLRTPQAVSAGITEYLIELGAVLDPSSLDIIKIKDYTFTPLHNAIYASDVTAVEKLLKLGTNPNTKSLDFSYTDDAGNPVTYLGQYALENALFNKKPKTFELLLQYGANPNVPDASGTPLLIHAFNMKNPIYAQLLLKHGANPNITYSTGIPLLHSEIWAKKSDNVKLLLEHGADPRVKDPSSNLSALEWIKISLPELYDYAQQKAEEWERYDVD